MNPTSVIGPAVAGSWYPADRDALSRQVDRFLDRAGGPPASASARPLALIAPHAGFVYSGLVAAHGFRLLHGRDVSRVLLLGPSHYTSVPGATVPRAASYRTPLGDVPLDENALGRLSEMPGFTRDDRPFGPEHSLEAEIPFLQRVLAPGWRLLPVLVGGTARAEDAERVADGLRPLVTGNTVVVVSSDFTHYGPRFHYVPFREDVEANLRRLDLGAVERITAGDAGGFARYFEETGATICGRRAIDALLRLLPDDAGGTLVAYDTSGRMTGDWDHSVSYAAIAFEAPRTEGRHPERETAAETCASRDATGSPEARLQPQEKTALLRLARAALEDRLREAGALDRALQAVTLTPALRAPGATFVTLERTQAHAEGRLRGCIGTMEAKEPLHQSVIDNARKAAFHDPRFPALTGEELDGVSLHVSVLTPVRPVQGPDEIVIGRHGVELTLGGRRAVFLPEVAVEAGWDRSELLSHLARKAGLPAESWHDAELSVFRTECFGEAPEGSSLR